MELFWSSGFLIPCPPFTTSNSSGNIFIKTNTRTSGTDRAESLTTGVLLVCYWYGRITNRNCGTGSDDLLRMIRYGWIINLKCGTGSDDSLRMIRYGWIMNRKCGTGSDDSLRMNHESEVWYWYGWFVTDESWIGNVVLVRMNYSIWKYSSVFWMRYGFCMNCDTRSHYNKCAVVLILMNHECMQWYWLYRLNSWIMSSIPVSDEWPEKIFPTTFDSHLPE